MIIIYGKNLEFRAPDGKAFFDSCINTYCQITKQDNVQFELCDEAFQYMADLAQQRKRKKIDAIVLLDEMEQYEMVEYESAEKMISVYHICTRVSTVSLETKVIYRVMRYEKSLRCNSLLKYRFSEKEITTIASMHNKTTKSCNEAIREVIKLTPLVTMNNN